MSIDQNWKLFTSLYVYHSFFMMNFWEIKVGLDAARPLAQISPIKRTKMKFFISLREAVNNNLGISLVK